jgi:hypothetical protein
MNFGRTKGMRRWVFGPLWSFIAPAREPHRTARLPNFDTSNKNDSTKSHGLLSHEQTSYQATKGAALRPSRRSVPGVWPGNGKLGRSSCGPVGSRRRNNNL